MSNRFANGRKAFGFCDLCGFRFDLKRLKNLVVKTKETQIKACPQCWTPDQPQLQLGMYPISDPQAIRNPRPDTNTWYQSGVNALGNVSEGMLIIQWGWNPVGGASYFDAPLTPNTLVGVGEVGSVTIGDTGTPQFTLVEVLYTTPGTYSWTAPAGVTSIYVLCVGGGGQGTQSTPIAQSSWFQSSSLAGGFVAGAGARGTAFSGGSGGGGPGNSTFIGGSVYGGSGGNGANRSSTLITGGGGGAGGYLGNGGAGGNATIPPTAGSGGGGAGGATDVSGGGVGLGGPGSSGIASGQGGSGGTDGTTSSPGVYGAGGRGLFAVSANSGGGGGALRWTPNRTVVPLTSYNLCVGAGGSTAPNVHRGGNGAVKIAYWLPVP